MDTEDEMLFKQPVSKKSDIQSKTEETPNLEDTIDHTGPPPGLFVIEVLKNGAVIETKNVTKSEVTFGRSRDCDFPLDHPSISRNHASIKWIPISYNPPLGKFFLKDFNSTHGSFVNKIKLTTGQVVRLEVNNSILKFGGSTRSFLLNSTDASYEEPKEEAPQCEDDVKEDGDNSEEEEQEDLESLYERISIFLQKEIPESKNEHAFSGNPVKAVQDWFEKEGLDFDHEVSHNHNNFRCKINVNIGGRDFTITSDPHPKKKDSINQTCLRVCRLLDSFKLLFPWQTEKTRKRKLPFLDKEDDEVLDETIDKKKRQTKQPKKEAETYESLCEKWTESNRTLVSLKGQLASLSHKEPGKEKLEEESVDRDSLDSFMTTLKDSKNTQKMRIEQSRLKLQIKEMEKQLKVYELLMKAAKPNVILSFVENTCVTRIPEKNDDRDNSHLESPVIRVKSFDPCLPNPLESLDDPLEQAAVMEPQVQKETSLAKESHRPQKYVKKPLTPKVLMKETPDEDFIDWVPPSGQDGSGKTSLNDKLGY
jgi:pSer/pThr/pTyr-binding forkhead associated (FHA) protein